MDKDQDNTSRDGSLDSESLVGAAINRASELLGDSTWSAEMLDGTPEAVYVWENVRGGRALIVASDQSVLFASSAVSPADHEAAFRSGRRTEIDAFNRGR